MRTGIVALIGRPNTGKSTLLNNLLGHKVSITSPKPQTTRFNIEAVYEDDRGQIIFVDTPGIFGQTHDPLSKKINPQAESALAKQIDLILYLVDRTRHRSYEENKTLGIVRKSKAPKILVINKIDIKNPDYMAEYKFMEDEFDQVVEISALKRLNLNLLMDAVFSRLPESDRPLVASEKMVQPGLNIDSKVFISEIIREKAFLFLRQELPYSLTATVDEITEKENSLLYVKARIITNTDRYKAMIVGKNGYMIKEISMAARKELETAANRKVFLDLMVEVDPHWVEYL